MGDLEALESLVYWRPRPPWLSAANAKVLSCAECGRWLYRGHEYWLCPGGHGLLIPEPILLRRLHGRRGRKAAVLRDFLAQQQTAERLIASGRFRAAAE